MGLIYRDKKGRFSKKEAKGAVLSGFRGGGKVEAINPKKITVITMKRGKGKPYLQYKSGGRFISKAAGEAAMKSEEFKAEKEKIAGELDINEKDVIASEVEFYNLQSVFSDLLETYKNEFVKLTFVNSLGFFIDTKNPRQAIKEVSQEGYLAAKEVEGSKNKNDSLILYDIEFEEGVFRIFRLN